MLPLLLLILSGVAAQGEIDFKGSVGAQCFLDDSAENHFLSGGSVRIYITRRLAFEPEVLYLRQSREHHDWVVLPNVVWDFRTGRVRPYVTGGVGWLRFVQRNLFTQNQWQVSAGFGVKVYLNDHWFVSPEARVGLEPHARLSVGLGYTFRR
jgi:hypothetical protein